MVKSKIKVLFAAAGAVFFFACAFLLFLPFPEALAAEGEEYLVRWENGTAKESYYSAYSALSGCTRECLLFGREGLRGELPASEAFQNAYALLEKGTLLDLLTGDFTVSTRIERAALYRKYEDVCFYSGDLFVFDGTHVVRTKRGGFGELVLLDGKLSAADLCASGAETLTVRADAEFSVDALVGSSVKELRAAEPYFVAGGALYRKTPGGVRLVAAAPSLTHLAVEKTDFCDEGALAPCTALSSLVLPFLGNTKKESFALSVLFGGEVPKTLAQIKVTGGTVIPFAFGGAENLFEIDLCGIAAEDVSETAFSGCGSLRKLHTSKKNLSLSGSFHQTELPCGCTLYERKEGIF